jgi:hypothetical protein
LRTREIRAQFFTGDELHRFDHGAAVTALPPRQPCQRTFAVVHQNASDAGVSHDVMRRKIGMPRPEGINVGRRYSRGITTRIAPATSRLTGRRHRSVSAA